VLIDGRVHYFVAHLVARTSTWSYAFVAMNAQWLGEWNMGPRAHPGDGLIDTYEASLGPADRLKVRSRLGHGAHLPHPGIRERRAAAVQVTLPRTLPIRLDGEVVGEGRNLSIRVQSDAFVVVV
jgi:diacylglycerol kinase family enzyme